MRLCEVEIIIRRELSSFVQNITVCQLKKMCVEGFHTAHAIEDNIERKKN
jgi:hypothetical protein